ncbi:MAG: sulfatase, partial [Planctomycetota bacterium]
APPIPFNRMYDPDDMPAPRCGDASIDHLDDFLPMMNYMTYAESVDPTRAKILKARYYGEISHIDDCLGRILDAVDAQADPSNTLICFFSDHGDHMGDHRSWQKESFFDAACRVPMLISWPHRLPAGRRSDALVTLTDLFGLATSAANERELREGIDLLAVAEGRHPGRSAVIGCYGQPGTRQFKVMVRDDQWKYIFLANGGRELLFDMDEDSCELVPRNGDRPEIISRMRMMAVAALKSPGTADALDGLQLKSLRFEKFPRRRLKQFDRSADVMDFPANPGDIVPGPPKRQKPAASRASQDAAPNV